MARSHPAGAGAGALVGFVTTAAAGVHCYEGESRAIGYVVAEACVYARVVQMQASAAAAAATTSAASATTEGSAAASNRGGTTRFRLLLITPGSTVAREVVAERW